MRFSCEMLSLEGFGVTIPNILRIVDHGDGKLYIEIEAKHDGHKVCSTVVVERCVFAYHVKASGILS